MFYWARFLKSNNIETALRCKQTTTWTNMFDLWRRDFELSSNQCRYVQNNKCWMRQAQLWLDEYIEYTVRWRFIWVRQVTGLCRCMHFHDTNDGTNAGQIKTPITTTTIKHNKHATTTIKPLLIKNCSFVALNKWQITNIFVLGHIQ